MNSFQFITDTQDFGAVKEGLEKTKLEITSAHLGYVALSTVDAPSEHVDFIIQLLETLEEVEDVVRIYDNFKLPS